MPDDLLTIRNDCNANTAYTMVRRDTPWNDLPSLRGIEVDLSSIDVPRPVALNTVHPADPARPEGP